jgi:hypothetical protein
MRAFLLCKGTWRPPNAVLWTSSGPPCHGGTRRRAALCAAICALVLAAPARGEVPLEFHGNVLFNEFVYRALLDLPDEARVSLSTARTVARQIARFLHDAGYQLATVRARVEGDHIRVDVEEGQLDKIVFLGEGAFETLRLKLELSLPFNVFNRPLLERQLKQTAARFQLQDFAYELVPVEEKSSSFQLDEVTDLQALPFVKPGRPYDLRIFVQPTAWGTGFSPDLYIGGLEGLGIGGHYQGRALIFADDRWDISARVAGMIRQHLPASPTDMPASRPVLTRALGQAVWFSPPFLTEGFRPALAFRTDLTSYQRPDLHLDGYDQLTLEVALGARLSLLPQLEVSFGLGLERRLLFDIESVGTPAPQVSDAPAAQNRPYGQALVRMTFNPDEIRRDRRHALDLDARLYGESSAGRSVMARVFGHYQKEWSLGWHELWVEGRGAILTGDVLFADERSIGDGLRGPFGSTDFTRKMAGLALEFRYSLLRDVFKVGIYHDAVVFGSIDRTVAQNGAETVAGANAAGLSIHALALDEFQIDAYYGWGWKTDGSTDHGLSLVIRQAF